MSSQGTDGGEPISIYPIGEEDSITILSEAVEGGCFTGAERAFVVWRIEMMRAFCEAPFSAELRCADESAGRACRELLGEAVPAAGVQVPGQFVAGGYFVEEQWLVRLTGPPAFVMDGDGSARLSGRAGSALTGRLSAFGQVPWSFFCSRHGLRSATGREVLRSLEGVGDKRHRVVLV